MKATRFILFILTIFVTASSKAELFEREELNNCDVLLLDFTKDHSEFSYLTPWTKEVLNENKKIKNIFSIYAPKNAHINMMDLGVTNDNLKRTLFIRLLSHELANDNLMIEVKTDFVLEQRFISQNVIIYNDIRKQSVFDISRKSFKLIEAALKSVIKRHCSSKIEVD